MHFKILAVLLLFISYNAHSAFMQFNFTGFVSSVENNANSEFDEASLLGQTISGSFTLDLSTEVYGRLETSWYWWGQVESGLPVLTSQLILGSKTYSLANQGIYNAFEDDYFPEEHIEMYNGPDYDGGPIGDGEYFSDFARFTEATSSGESILSYALSIYFFDIINDFLVFSEETELFDKQPDFSQPFFWEDTNFTDNNQQGTGSLRVRESFYPTAGGFERNIDSTLGFTLASVSAIRVDSPSTWVIMIIFLSLLIRKRVTVS
ncbi:conserved exported hypothetical protein [Alteromonas sp. 38]|uniref:hypothetical protein n=1 Tax=Alteromonas TaxID=226 RepID=UPI0012EF01B3|nr:MULTISPECIES: hypothetical protein [Alteromonas]CAD5280316.1 conserved exported hypothetical protein [Alteromonas sp. 154]VXB79999.1 conserved exported hypothetical protein [Alteromonas sp. 38]